MPDHRRTEPTAPRSGAVTSPPSRRPPRGPVFYAHRGASLELPENTLESFARALELGAHAIETDAHVTCDGHAVLSHDETGMRAAGVPDAIAERTLTEVQRWDAGKNFTDPTGARTQARRGVTIPTLAEALRAFPDTRFNVDVKPRDGSAAHAVVRTVRDARACERVLLTSFHFPTITRVRALGYEGPTGLSRREVLALLGLPLPLARRAQGALVGEKGTSNGLRAQIPYRLGRVSLGTPAVLDRLHALGIFVDYWTVNELDVARALLALGADGIMTDDPARIAPAFVS